MRSLGGDVFGNEQFVGQDTDGSHVLLTKHADAQPITDRNAELRKRGAGNGRDLKLAASVPLSIIMKWKVEHGVDAFSNDPAHQKRLKQLLNDHQNRMFRIWEGNI